MLQLGYVHEIRFKPNVNFIRCVVQFVTIRAIKKLEKRPWRSVNFSKVAGLSLSLQLY